MGRLRESEFALGESERRYRTVVDSVRDAVAQIDSDGRRVFLNPAWETIPG